MKKVYLKKLELQNFKGIKSLIIDFKDVIHISGKNGTGKTSITDAFTWLLFGKDSLDRKDFNIKNTKIIVHKLEHTVIGVIDVDGKVFTLKRVYKEKWQKKRGTENEEMTGHETLYYIDDVPHQAGQYQIFVNSLVDDAIFKMVTNPLYFNSIKWTDRRAILTKIAGEVDETEIINSDEKYKLLLEKLSGKTFAAYKAQISATKKKLKDDLETIPSRIDEVTRAIPEEPDYTLIEQNLKGFEAGLKTIEGQIEDQSKRSEEQYKAIQEKQKKVHELKTRLQQIEFEEKNKVNAEYNQQIQEKQKLEGEYNRLLNLISALESGINKTDELIKIKTQRKNDLLKTWHEKNNKVFDESSLNCPTCGTPFSEEKKDELRANFNTEKVKRLTDISTDGKAINDEITTLSKELTESQEKRTGYLAQSETVYTKLSSMNIQPVVPNLSANDECNNIITEIQQIDQEIKNQQQISDPQLQESKKELSEKIYAEKSKLAIKEQVQKSKLRIQELEAQSKNLSQQLADLEKDEFVIDSFTKAKISLVEERVNSMFKYAKFQMFNTLINGSTEEICETLYDGVPWSDLNSGHKIWVGIDIINTLSEFFGFSAPIFLDNRESTNDIPDTQAQVVNLYVTLDDKLVIN